MLPEGIHYPVLTPFKDNGDVDHQVLTEIVEFACDKQVSSIFALGSAGQGPAMEKSQREEALETIISSSDVPVIAHVGAVTSQTSIQLAEHADSIGCDALSLLPPYYYSDHSTYEITEHFKSVADCTDLDIMIYNNPKYTDINLQPNDVKVLAESIPNISGIKLSFIQDTIMPDLNTVIDYIERTPDEFSVFPASMSQLYPTFYHGATGSVHPPTVVWPELAVEFWGSIVDNQFEHAVEFQKRIYLLERYLGEVISEYGRSVYLPLYRSRGIDIQKYPRWETKPIPKDEQQELVSRVRTIEGADDVFSR